MDPRDGHALVGGSRALLVAVAERPAVGEVPALRPFLRQKADALTPTAPTVRNTHGSVQTAFDLATSTQIPRHVNRAVMREGRLYVLQGLSHIVIGQGHLATTWAEHGEFVTRVVARYRTEPVDWIAESDGTWTVATLDAIWRTSDTNQLVARIPTVRSPLSLSRATDGTFYVGLTGSVLRLTPTWAEAPRYVTEQLVPTQPEFPCRIQ